MRFKTLFSASLLALTVSSFGQVVSVVPPAFENVATNGTFLGQLANGARTYQFLIRGDQLTAHVGRLLNGITYRSLVSATTAWPTAPVTFNNYDIRLSGSVLPANRSLTFALNVVGPQTLVRSGSLTIDTNTFGFGGSPAPFGPIIAFQTPYLYTGGELLIELRHTGFTGTSRTVEAVLATNGPAGVYGQQVSACWTGSYTGVTGSQGNFAIIKLTSADSSSNVTGIVDYGNVGPTYNTGPFPGTIPVSFRNAANTEIATGSASYNAVTGALSASVPGAVTVPYRVSFKLGFWLRKTMPNPADPAAPVGNYNFGTVAPMVGDVDDDNDITSSDYSIWAGNNGNSVTPNTDADFDGDGEITSSDYALWAGNNGNTGDN